MRKTKFSYLMWHYTGAHENLFDLTREERAVFALLVENANRGQA